MNELINILGNAQNEKDTKRKDKARARAAEYMRRKKAEEEKKKSGGKVGKRIHENLLKEIGSK